MNNNIDDLRYIRSTMERSTKFLSLSGMSGVAAGIFALTGATVAYFIIHGCFSLVGNTLSDLIITALIVIAGASVSGLYFSMQKAKKTGAKFWMPVTFQIVKDAGLPMITGGIFCILLIYHHCSFMVASAMLVFYGISLINAGTRTYRDIRILGACEILLGILAGIFTTYGLFFWAIGFGVLHIVYGIVMYTKYDATPNKKD